MGARTKTVKTRVNEELKHMANTSTDGKQKDVKHKITTPIFRASFAAVIQPKPPKKAGDKPKYSITMLFQTKKDPAKPHEEVVNLDEMKAAVRAAVIEKWGPDPAKWPKKPVLQPNGQAVLGPDGKPQFASAIRLPFRNGAEKDYDGYNEFVTFVSATSVRKPGIVDRDGKTVITEESAFYSGCYARATINAYAYDTDGNQGIAFGLRNIQKAKDGAAFGGGGDPTNDFDAIPVPEGDPTAVAGGAAAGAAEDPLGM